MGKKAKQRISFVCDAGDLIECTKVRKRRHFELRIDYFVFQKQQQPAVAQIYPSTDKY